MTNLDDNKDTLISIRSQILMITFTTAYVGSLVPNFVSFSTNAFNLPSIFS